MPTDLLMVAVDWYGPFKDTALARKTGEKEDVGEFLYLAYEPAGARSYVGLSSNTARLSNNHHVLKSWAPESFDLWVGIIKSQGEPGRRPADSYEAHSAVLHFAEHMTAYFVETSENRSKRKSPPNRSGVVLNRWFGIDENWTRLTRRPHKNWPDFIEFDKGRCARVVWFGRENLRYDVDQIAGLRRKD